jgi:hypothetical protein
MAAETFSSPDSGAVFARTLELLHRKPKLDAQERRELRQLLSRLSANEILALQADRDRVRELRQSHFMRRLGWKFWLTMSAWTLLAALLWLTITAFSRGALSAEDREPMAVNGHG